MNVHVADGLEYFSDGQWLIVGLYFLNAIVVYIFARTDMKIAIILL